jgi:hypothetical protein
MFTRLSLVVGNRIHGYGPVKLLRVIRKPE